MGMRSFNPYIWAFGLSHEELNRWHQALGHIISILWLFHGSLYLGCFQTKGILLQKLSSPSVVIGPALLIGLMLLNATSLHAIRHLSYRSFLIAHIAFSLVSPVLLYFHTRHVRLFVLEALACYFVDLFIRKKRSIMTSALLQPLPHANLIRISAVVPPEKIKHFRPQAGVYVYVRLIGTTNFSISNPFTVENFDTFTGTVTILARPRYGPFTRALTQIAQTNPYHAGAISGTESCQVLLSLEGPYGSALHFPRFSGASFDSVLLVAAGVGATFILPIYGQIRQEKYVEVRMVWIIRDRTETNVYSAAGDVLSDKVQVLETQESQRPDLKVIVDNAFEGFVGHRVAILVCGPYQMSSEIRRHVTPWVGRGWNVWWHSEQFS